MFSTTINQSLACKVEIANLLFWLNKCIEFIRLVSQRKTGEKERGILCKVEEFILEKSRSGISVKSFYWSVILQSDNNRTKFASIWNRKSTVYTCPRITWIQQIEANFGKYLQYSSRNKRLIITSKIFSTYT